MKKSFGQQFNLVGLILGIICLISLLPLRIPQAYAASETAWQITDMDSASITTPRAGDMWGWQILFLDSAGLTNYGDIWDSENNFNDGGTSVGAESLRIDFVSMGELVNVQAGDTLTLAADGTPSNITVYLPALAGDDSLWVADDGSTYYDDALTSLAYSAPITIDVSIDNSSAYDFSSSNGPLLPDQTYTSADDVKNITAVCNNSSGWVLYVKSTGNFTSGVNSIAIGNLEWKYTGSSWTDMTTSDTSVRSSSDPTSASGVTTGMEYRINIPYNSVPADNYTAKITFTVVVQ